jgi:hypothetical protein
MENFMMRYFDKSIPMLAALFLVACGGGGGGSAPAQLTVASFTEFKLTENSAGSWPIEASITTLTSITNTISGGPDATSFTISGKHLHFLVWLTMKLPLISIKMECLRYMLQLLLAALPPRKQFT